MRMVYKMHWAALVVGILASTAACKRSATVPDEPVAVVQEATDADERSDAEAEQDAEAADADAVDDAADDTDASKAEAGVESEVESAETDDDDAHEADPEQAAEEEAAPKGFSWARETIGPLQFGMSADDVRAALGEPTEKEDPEEEPATGLFKAFWGYPDQGVWMALAHKSEDPASSAYVVSFSIRAPSTFKTSRGVGIGSSFSSVKRAYRKVKDPDQEYRSIVISDERILVGSVYGGMDFGFENGRMTDIFIGAGAE